MTTQYNHAFDIAFEVVSQNTGESITAEELLKALEDRVNHFKQHPDELIEACGMPFDSYEID